MIPRELKMQPTMHLQRQRGYLFFYIKCKTWLTEPLTKIGFLRIYFFNLFSENLNLPRHSFLRRLWEIWHWQYNFVTFLSLLFPPLNMKIPLTVQFRKFWHKCHIRLVKSNCEKTKSFWENVYCLHKCPTAEAFLLHSPFKSRSCLFSYGWNTF
jgi:hypothetical protein